MGETQQQLKSGPGSGLFWKSAVRTILLAGFIAGLLDLLSAIIQNNLILQRTSTERLLQGIANAIFRGRAFSGGLPMALYGLLLHFLIAYSFTIAYFLLFPYIGFLSRHKIISGLLYGMVIWSVMNLVVLRLVFPQLSMPSFSSFITAAAILMIMVGLPVSLIIPKYYYSKT
jgi:hypothetical protein